MNVANLKRFSNTLTLFTLPEGEYLIHTEDPDEVRCMAQQVIAVWMGLV